MKKLLFLTLSLVLSIGLVSCNNKNEEKDPIPLDQVVIEKESDLETFIDLLEKNYDYEAQMKFYSKTDDHEVKVNDKILFDGNVEYKHSTLNESKQEESVYDTYIVKKDDKYSRYGIKSGCDEWDIVDNDSENKFLLIEKNITTEDINNNFTKTSDGKYKFTNYDSLKEYKFLQTKFDEYVITVAKNCKSASIHATLDKTEDNPLIENATMHTVANYDVTITLKDNVEFEYPDKIK